MKNNIMKRLDALEARYKTDPLIIEAKTESGEVVMINALELENRPDLTFYQVISGSDINGIRCILDTQEIEAIMYVDNVSYEEAKEIRKRERSEFKRKYLENN